MALCTSSSYTAPLLGCRPSCSVCVCVCTMRAADQHNKCKQPRDSEVACAERPRHVGTTSSAARLQSASACAPRHTCRQLQARWRIICTQNDYFYRFYNSSVAMSAAYGQESCATDCVRSMAGVLITDGLAETSESHLSCCTNHQGLLLLLECLGHCCCERGRPGSTAHSGGPLQCKEICERFRHTMHSQACVLPLPERSE